MKVVVTGGPGDVRLGWEVARHMSTTPTLTAGNLTLPRTIALIARCEVFLCADSGPMHLAAALGTPLVALFGATDPEIWGPRGAHCKVVQALAPCGPRPSCGAGPYPRCPRGTAACMNAISVEEVLAAVEELLRARVPAPAAGESEEAR
jgi:ADP-heptose:LPS heptosyltransferase